MTMLILFILIHSLSLITINCDCGLPAIPDLTKLTQFKTRYDDNSVVGYECEDVNSELIEGKHRTCADNRWNGSLPRCAKLHLTDQLTRIQISELKSHKPLYREMQYSSQMTPRRLARIVNNEVKYHDCPKPRYLWYVNQNQMWTFFLKRDYYFNYFSLFLKSESLLEHYNQNRLVLTASIEDSIWSLKCRIERFKQLNDSFTHKIGFICDRREPNGQIHEGIEESLTRIVVQANVDNLTNTTMIFCDLKLYELSHSCGAPERPLNSILLAREMTYSVFSCRDGYRLEGQQRVQCSSEGTWLDPFPLCVPIKTCPIPAIDVDDPLLMVEYRHFYRLNGTKVAEPDDVALYLCNNITNTTSMRMEGLSTRVCKDGKWSGSQPVCRIQRDEQSLQMSYQSESEKKQISKPMSISKIFVVIMAMLGSFFIGAVSVAAVVLLVFRRRNKCRKRPKISIVVDDTDDTDYMHGEHYSSLRASLASNVSNELVNPLYEDYKKFGNSLDIPSEDN